MPAHPEHRDPHGQPDRAAPGRCHRARLARLAAGPDRQAPRRVAAPSSWRCSRTGSRCARRRSRCCSSARRAARPQAVVHRSRRRAVRLRGRGGARRRRRRARRDAAAAMTTAAVTIAPPPTRRHDGGADGRRRPSPPSRRPHVAGDDRAPATPHSPGIDRCARCRRRQPAHVHVGGAGADDRRARRTARAGAGRSATTRWPSSRRRSTRSTSSSPTSTPSSRPTRRPNAVHRARGWTGGHDRSSKMSGSVRHRSRASRTSPVPAAVDPRGRRRRAGARRGRTRARAARLRRRRGGRRRGRVRPRRQAPARSARARHRACPGSRGSSCASGSAMSTSTCRSSCCRRATRWATVSPGCRPAPTTTSSSRSRSTSSSLGCRRCCGGPRHGHGGRRAASVAGPLWVDAARRIATVHGNRLELSRREFDLLAAFAANPGIVLSRIRLLELVWGYDFEVDTNVVDVFVGYLRRKLDAAGAAEGDRDGARRRVRVADGRLMRLADPHRARRVRRCVRHAAADRARVPRSVRRRAAGPRRRAARRPRRDRTDPRCDRGPTRRVPSWSRTVEPSRVLRRWRADRSSATCRADPLPAPDGARVSDTVVAGGSGGGCYTIEVSDVPAVGDRTLVQLAEPLGDVDEQVRELRRRGRGRGLARVGRRRVVGWFLGGLAARPLTSLRRDAGAPARRRPVDLAGWGSGTARPRSTTSPRR